MDGFFKFLSSFGRRDKFWLVILLLAFVTFLCGLVHWGSESGTPVKLFWGGLEYTKERSPDVRCDPGTKQDAQLRRVAAAGPSATTDAALQKFREDEHIWSLASKESGKPLEEMPINSYGFISGARFDSNVKRLIAEGKVLSDGKPSGTKFEVQKNRAGQIYLVAFVSASDSQRAMEQSLERRNITLYPKPTDGPFDLLVIPEAALISAAIRRIQPGGGREMVVIEATLAPSAN